MKSNKINLLVMLIIVTVLVLTGFSNANNIDIEVAGTIRNTGKGWNVLSDTQHTPIGITKVETRNNMILLRHELGAKQVVTFIVTPDETMARDGIAIGVSAGLDFSFIYLYDKEGNLINPQTYFASGSNIWIYGKLK